MILIGTAPKNHTEVKVFYDDQHNQIFIMVFFRGESTPVYTESAMLNNWKYDKNHSMILGLPQDLAHKLQEFVERLYRVKAFW